MNNYQLLISKLDQFIRKYYLNQIIRGVLYSVGLVLILFVAFALLEHYYFFSKGTRKLMVYSFLGVSGLALSVWVLLPMLRYFRLGRVISHEQAANIIGAHFVDVKDKLLNILQLKYQSEQSTNKALILASINQKSESIKLVPFKKAIDLGQNRRYLRYALPPLMLLIVLLLAAPSLITESTNRLIRNNEDFEPPAPFQFVVDEADLEVVQFEDYPLTVEVDGEVLPNEVFIDIDNHQYRLTKQEANRFTYRFSNVQKNTDFKLFSSGVQSADYELNVLKKPNIMGFEVTLDYPNYTQRRDEKLNSIGDVVVPIGTNLDWVFNAQNTDQIGLRFFGDDETSETKRFSDELFTFQKRALRDETYQLYVGNADLPNADSVAYTITIIPDQYPAIEAQKFKDSLDNRLLYFVGDASDDYGLRSLTFNYRVTRNKGAQGELQQVPLDKGNAKNVQFDHTFDLHELELKPGDEVTYYFEVFDNDGVNGSKSARTNVDVFEMPTVEQYEQMEEENDTKIKDKLQKSLEESRKVQEEMKKLREKLLQEKELDWQSRKELEKLLERQKELQKEINDAKQAFDENLENQQEFSEQDEQIMEKQEKLQKLFEEVMSDEMKEMMQKLDEMLQEMQKDEALEMMEDMEMDDEELEMELDRMLEMFKQLELEMEMEKTIDELEKLAEEQEQLSEDTQELEEQKDQMSEQEQADKQDELEEKQKELSEAFDKVQEKMEEMDKKNEELENPMQMSDTEQQEEEIQQEQQNSEQQLQQQQNQKASESQKKAGEKMREMAQQMAQQMQSQEMEQMEEDMQALRQLLENLVGLSFDQEQLMDDIGTTNVNTPRYVEKVQVQHKLQDDFRLIEDSLQELSKRVYQIESFVTEKVTDIKSNMNKSLKELEERKKPQALEHQQRTMTNVNDLALMLSEVMNQMQQQMSSMMQGNQMCNNPGGKGSSGKVPKDKISQGQQSINEQMQQMMQRMQKGEKGSSKEFAEMAAKQAALRKALREKQKQMQQEGKGKQGQQLQDMIEQMDKVETDLVNKKLTNEMMQRQEEILTRLLEHEQAEQEREYDNKRKSKVGQYTERKLPPSLEEYIKKREAEIDQYKSVSPSLKPYYKFLVEEYFKKLKE